MEAIKWCLRRKNLRRLEQTLALATIEIKETKKGGLFLKVKGDKLEAKLLPRQCQIVSAREEFLKGEYSGRDRQILNTLDQEYGNAIGRYLAIGIPLLLVSSAAVCYPFAREIFVKGTNVIRNLLLIPLAIAATVKASEYLANHFFRPWKKGELYQG